MVTGHLAHRKKVIMILIKIKFNNNNNDIGSFYSPGSVLSAFHRLTHFILSNAGRF